MRGILAITYLPVSHFAPNDTPTYETAGLTLIGILSPGYGAGHDAFYLARVAPSGMIFIPCEDGISHNPIESATSEDCAAGCQVLLEVAMSRAGL